MNDEELAAIEARLNGVGSTYGEARNDARRLLAEVRRLREDIGQRDQTVAEFLASAQEDLA